MAKFLNRPYGNRPDWQAGKQPLPKPGQFKQPEEVIGTVSERQEKDLDKLLRRYIADDAKPRARGKRKL